MLTGVEEFLIFGFMPLMIGIFTAPILADAPGHMLSGKVTTPPSPVMPYDAMLTVELVELRRGEPGSAVLAQEAMRWRGSDAQKFAMRIDPSLVQPNVYYALRARVVVANGSVLLETPYAQPASPLSGDQPILAMKAAGTTQDSAKSS
jgi:putative lipoprotein